MTEPRYIVHWCYIDPTKAAGGCRNVGNGEPMSRSAAEAYVNACNLAYPTIHHWMMPASLAGSNRQPLEPRPYRKAAGGEQIDEDLIDSWYDELRGLCYSELPVAIARRAAEWQLERALRWLQENNFTVSAMLLRGAMQPAEAPMEDVNV